MFLMFFNMFLTLYRQANVSRETFAYVKFLLFQNITSKIL